MNLYDSWTFWLWECLIFSFDIPMHKLLLLFWKHSRFRRNDIHKIQLKDLEMSLEMSSLMKVVDRTLVWGIEREESGDGKMGRGQE